MAFHSGGPGLARRLDRSKRPSRLASTMASTVGGWRKAPVQRCTDTSRHNSSGSTRGLSCGRSVMSRREHVGAAGEERGQRRLERADVEERPAVEVHVVGARQAQGGAGKALRQQRPLG